MIAEGFTCQRYGFNVGADKFSLLTIENGKTSIMRLSEWTLISQSQKSHSDRLLEEICFNFDLTKCFVSFVIEDQNFLFNRSEILSDGTLFNCEVLKKKMEKIFHLEQCEL